MARHAWGAFQVGTEAEVTMSRHGTNKVLAEGLVSVSLNLDSCKLQLARGSETLSP